MSMRYDKSKKTNIQALYNLHITAISYHRCSYYSQSLSSSKISFWSEFLMGYLLSPSIT